MQKNIELSIIIVNYCADEDVQRLLSGFKELSNWEIIVVDNSKQNIGYGAGCNEGAKKAAGRYYLFLNPDLLISQKDILLLLHWLKEHKEFASVGPQFRNLDGSIERTCSGKLTPGSAAICLSFLKKLPAFSSFKETFFLEDWDRKTSKEVYCINGAALLVRASDFWKIKGFDEQFFLYWEEHDLCERLHQIGKRIYFLANAKVMHEKGKSTSKTTFAVKAYAKSRAYYFKKHFGLFWMIVLEWWLRMGEFFAKRKNQRKNS